MKVSNLKSITIKLTSPDEIMNWSHGEVTEPETINYRTQKPEKDGLFDERIFGPVKDYECACGKYKRIRYKGVVCDRCGVEVTKSRVRRERMGHIKLAVPVSHIWFLRGIPSKMGIILDKSSRKMERVIYFSSYIVTKVDKEAKKRVLKEIKKEAKVKLKEAKKKEKTKIKKAEDKAEKQLKSIKRLKVLSEHNYRKLSLKYGEIFEAGTGAETVYKIFEKMDLKKRIKKLKKKSKSIPASKRKKILRKLKLFEKMERGGVKPEWMFLKVLPVLPPDLRPMVQLDGGRYASSDLNDLYRRVINRNNRLKYLLEISAPEVIVRNEKRMLQEAVDALIDNNMRKGVTTTATTGQRRLLKSLADMLKGKQGRFRQNLLGKRVDYSGRSVIAVGPELHFYQCGLPKTMALEIFKPFVIREILDQELAYNIKGATRLIEEHKPEVWAILEEIVKDKLVLLNRAPTLHRLGVQAFQPVLIEGETIKVHPLVCEAFNADFDGDQMAVFLPLSEEAQKEAREIMLSSLNVLKPATGRPIIGPYREIVLGSYYLTKTKEDIEEGEKTEEKPRIFSSVFEAELAYENRDIDIRQKIKIPEPKAKESKLIETTVGRVIFNDALPEDYPFQNKLFTSGKLKDLISDLIKKYSSEKIPKILDDIKDMGFEYSTLSGISWGMDDLIIPEEKEGLIKEADKKVEEIDGYFKKGLLTYSEKISQEISVWQKVKTEIEKLLKEKTLPRDGSVYSIISSGGRASWTQPVQMAGMKGLAVNPAGEIIELPIKSSFKEGFNVLEYFISTHGARKGTADTALRTSTAGYLSRRLIDVAHDMIITEKDCKEKKGMTILREDADEIEQDFFFKIVGRVCAQDIKEGRKKLAKKGEVIDWDKAKKISKAKINEVQVYSPLSCKSRQGICQKCYGWDLSRNELAKMGEPVGVVAAQSIGEPGTQLTLRTFHLGGVAGKGDITQGLPRVDEIFETRSPKGKAPITQFDGKITDVDTEKGIIKARPVSEKTPSSKKEISYKIPADRAVWVQKGEEVKAGQPLCEGSLDLEKFFRITDKERTQRYIVKEIQKIYVSQGVDVHDKHIEVIVHKMFSRMKIMKGGDSPWTKGEIIEKPVFEKEVKNLKSQKKTPPKAKQIILGISKVALTSDSVLSAASFQQTARVLIKSALEAKEDELKGLKENVIIGKLIPVGTGFRK